MMRGASDFLSGWKDEPEAVVASIIPATILGEQHPRWGGHNSGIDSTYSCS